MNCIRILFVVVLLLCTSWGLHAQKKSAADVDLEVKQEGAQKLYYYKGEPLEGRWKIRYISDDWVVRYYLTDFRSGMRSDTLWHYDLKSEKLYSREIRISEREKQVTEYYFSMDMLFREYHTLDGHYNGTFVEYYNNNNNSPYLIREYADGRLEGMSVRYNSDGTIASREPHKDNMYAGWAEYWNYDKGVYTRRYYREGGADVIEELYQFGPNWGRLTSRTVSRNGETLYTSSKPRCDEVSMDTLGNGDIEIRDYLEHSLVSVERYDSDLIPDGVFETYRYEDGSLESKKLYERGDLVMERYYDPEDDYTRRMVTLTRLGADEVAELKKQNCNSKYLDKSDDVRPLAIRSREGRVIFELPAEEGRRYEYNGYDPELKLHLGFSSEGDYNEVRWYVLHDGGDGEPIDMEAEFLEVSAPDFALNGRSGLIASANASFEGDHTLIINQYMVLPEESGFVTMPGYELRGEISVIRELCWIGDKSLLVVGEEGGVRLDFDFEVFDYSDEPE